jgi:hypothetical protein
MNNNSNYARVMYKGSKVKTVPKSEVDYELPHPTEMYSLGSLTAPMFSSMAAARLFVTGKFANQGLALRNPEAPLVQGETDVPGQSFEQLYGKKVGAVHADVSGKVVKVTPDEITVRGPAGTKTIKDGVDGKGKDVPSAAGMNLTKLNHNKPNSKIKGNNQLAFGIK